MTANFSLSTKGQSYRKLRQKQSFCWKNAASTAGNAA